ncbi:MAG: hypothetical protein KGJ60_08295 [Verrucomicrobiota bacterium]|nr:hypothetical protein [Verrucomicrobiota bacterium]
MNSKYPYGLGPGGKWLIFSVAFWAVATIIFTSVGFGRFDEMELRIGTAATLCVIWGTITGIGIVAMIVYSRLSQQLAMWLGVIGWIVTVSLGYWFFGFGPGAFGHN